MFISHPPVVGTQLSINCVPKTCPECGEYITQKDYCDSCLVRVFFENLRLL